MSKWINQDLFNEFQKEKKEEKENPESSGIRRSDLVWETPAKGTETQPKTYIGRFIPDKNGQFYKAYYYHMYRSGDKWVFILCPKTESMETFCPFCLATNKLYQGGKADKKIAYNYKRKKKFVSNFFIIDDPRDSERDDEKKVNGTVMLYEFPSKVEMKLKEEITDTENGLGYLIFDPSENGYNFILKILSTKKDDKGNSWPDYSSSAFARKASVIADSDEGIEKIMENTHDLEEYIQGLMKSDEELEKLLKEEMLYEYVEDEWDRVKGKEETVRLNKEEIDGEPSPEDYNSEPDDVRDSGDDESKNQTDDSDDDAALLAELDKM